MSRYERMCRSKRRYCTKEFTQQVAKRILQKDPSKNKRPYRCPYCQGFHLTKCDKRSSI